MLKTDIACNRSVLGEALKSILNCHYKRANKRQQKGYHFKTYETFTVHGHAAFGRYDERKVYPPV